MCANKHDSKNLLSGLPAQPPRIPRILENVIKAAVSAAPLGSQSHPSSCAAWNTAGQMSAQHNPDMEHHIARNVAVLSQSSPWAGALHSRLFSHMCEQQGLVELSAQASPNRATSLNMLLQSQIPWNFPSSLHNKYTTTESWKSGLAEEVLVGPP